MINFSYLQIGLIQAFAGYFTYMVVLNSYGFPPWVLLSRGNAEFWGVQPMYCRFEGGVYVNHYGEIDVDVTTGRTRDPSTTPPRRQYPMWAATAGAYVQDCRYPVNNFRGNDKGKGTFDNCEVLRAKRTGSQANADGNWCGREALYNNGGGQVFTDHHHQIPIESIYAAEDTGYYEYIPFKSKLSPFWNDNYLWWQTDWRFLQTGNLPFESVQLFFAGRVPGLFSVCDSSNQLVASTTKYKSDWRGADRPPQPPANAELCPGTANGADWPADGKRTFGSVGLFCNGLTAGQ